MARVWLINCRGIAKKVKNATSNYQLRDFGDEANRECPNCQHIIDNSDISSELPGLPAGVKFDPTDVEILEHLAGKAGVGIAKAHIFIDEFIPTIDGEEGICYTHPENLPGMRKDGKTVHFFHRSLNAYATGSRKRRKIRETEERLRWHKTGKTKPVVENGVVKGWKKIMVLYKSVGKGSKPDKANWVMHQYHLGMDEEEKDGEFVVSKIFYQQTKHVDGDEIEKVQDKSNVLTVRYGLRTIKNTTQPPRCKLNLQEKQAPEVELPPSTYPIVNLKDEELEFTLFAGESKAIEEPNTQLKNEHLSPSRESSLQLNYPDMIRGYKDQLEIVTDSAYGFPRLEDLEVDTPPDFQLSDLQFGSQDSITSWLDQL